MKKRYAICLHPRAYDALQHGLPRGGKGERIHRGVLRDRVENIINAALDQEERRG